MQVGQMLVRVRHRLVFMRMRVPYPGREAWMNVGVMVDVMPVAVRVHQRLVGVFVTVARGQHEVETHGNARSRGELGELDVLAEQRPREDHPQERRGGKQQL